MGSNRLALAAAFVLLCAPVAVTQSEDVTGGRPRKGGGAIDESSGAVLRLDLPRAVAIALDSNQRSKISRFSVEAALALHQQAMSSWWPTLSAQLAGTRMDQDPNFVVPSFVVALPPSSIQLPATTITLPANSFGPGFPPVNVPLPIPPMSLDVPAQSIPIPKQDIPLMDRDILMGSIKFSYPLYTGGLRGSMISQAKEGVEASRQEERRTGQEVIYDVRRVYHGGVLAHKLVRIGTDTLERMQATQDLTEQLYQTGSGRVKKTDFLRNKAVVESLRSLVAELEAMEKTSKAALLTVMGLDWNTEIELADEEIPFTPGESDSATLVERAFGANPQIARVEAGVRAAEAAVRAVRSGHLPKVGFFASANKIWNSFDAGLVSPQNKAGWAFGIGMEIPIFQGFRVMNEEREARANLEKLKQQLALLRSATALEVKRTCYELEQTQRQYQASRDAYQSAVENRELNVRAYQEELVDTKDVIEAQLMEALLSGQHQKVLYDHAAAQAKLDLAAGTEVKRLVQTLK